MGGERSTGDGGGPTRSGVEHFKLAHYLHEATTGSRTLRRTGKALTLPQGREKP